MIADAKLKPKIVSQRVSKQQKSAERFYAFTAFMSLIWQYCTVIYYPIMRSPLATLVTALDLFLWGIAWLQLTISKHAFQRQFFIVCPALILFLFLVCKLIIAGNYSNAYCAPSRAVYQIYSLIYALLWGSAFRLLSQTNQKKIVLYFYLALAITVLPSYLYVYKFKDAIRNESPYYGIIDFQYIYSVIPLIGMTIVLLIRCKLSKELRFVMSFMVLSNIGIIIISNFATAMVFICMTVFFSLLLAKNINLKKMFGFIVVLLLVIFICRKGIGKIFFMLETNDMFSVVMQHRLHDIGKILYEGELGWSFIARFNLMFISLDTFIKNPIFGVSFDYGDAVVLGFHDTWVTLLGYGGLFALFLVASSIILFLKSIVKTIHNKYFIKLCLSMLLIVLCLSFFNPILTKSILMISLGIMPSLDCVYKSKRGNYAKYRRSHI